MNLRAIIFCIVCALPAAAYADITYSPFPNYSETNGVASVHIPLGDGIVAVVNGSGASSTVQYDHEDALQSTTVVTNAAAAPTEFLGYSSYGAPRVATHLSGQAEQRTYINEYADPSGLSYLNARYYDPTRGQFISEDPLFWSDPAKQNLLDPQTQNAYSYGSDNPTTKKDPSGLLTIIVPGTFYRPSDWTSKGPEASFISEVGKSLNDSAHVKVVNDPSVWSGSDSVAARDSAAAYISTYIDSYHFAPNEPLNLVGHSHGGSIAIEVSDETTHPINNLVTLATPVRNDYQPNPLTVMNHVNAYSSHDPVQDMLGGTGASVSGILGSIFFHTLGYMLGSFMNYDEVGPAGRTYPGAQNVNVSKQTGWGITAHTEMTDNPAIWNAIVPHLHS
jgi:RHS repeat-associated protein